MNELPLEVNPAVLVDSPCQLLLPRGHLGRVWGFLQSDTSQLGDHGIQALRILEKHLLSVAMQRLLEESEDVIFVRVVDSSLLKSCLETLVVMAIMAGAVIFQDELQLLVDPLPVLCQIQALLLPPSEGLQLGSHELERIGVDAPLHWR